MNVLRVRHLYILYMYVVRFEIAILVSDALLVHTYTGIYKLTSMLNFSKAAKDFSGDFTFNFCKTDSISIR